MDLFGESGAIISEDQQYRYLLWRIWNNDLKKVCFIMLNPSTADANEDDPTIRRCKGFARDWGYGGFYVANLFAYRATDPNELFDTPDPYGPENEKYLKLLAAGESYPADIVFAWGSFPRFIPQMWEVIHMFKDPLCIDLANQGFPRHPLYLSAALEPKLYPVEKFLKS